MKEFTADDCVKDVNNNNGSRSFYFECEENGYEVIVESITLQLSEEVERQNGGTAKEFAAIMLNKHLTEVKEQGEIKDFFEEIST